MIKIAITGNIASGKTQVEKIISKNYPVYDTDKMAHEILDKLKEFYGLDVFTNGKIDRKKLADLVFSNPEIKVKLEKIVHPKVKDKIFELFEKHKNDKYIFISVPLLYETGFESLFDKVILVTIPQELQIERLMNRNNLTRNDALKRINSQAKQEYKIEKADYIIENHSDLSDLNQKVTQLLAMFE